MKFITNIFEGVLQILQVVSKTKYDNKVNELQYEIDALNADNLNHLEFENEYLKSLLATLLLDSPANGSDGGYSDEEVQKHGDTETTVNDNGCVADSPHYVDSCDDSDVIVDIVNEPTTQSVVEPKPEKVELELPNAVSKAQLSAKKGFTEDQYTELKSCYKVFLEEAEMNLPERTYGYSRMQFAKAMNQALGIHKSDTTYFRALGARN